MSHSQHCGCWGHIEDGHEVLHRGSIMAPATVLTWDPCPSGFSQKDRERERERCVYIYMYILYIDTHTNCLDL